MPHLVIEYSRDVENRASPQDMMVAAHRGALASGLFSLADIKVRAYPCDHALVAGAVASFVHVSIFLLSGRDAATQRKLTDTVLAEFSALDLGVASLSVDSRGMDRAVYTKLTK